MIAKTLGFVNPPIWLGPSSSRSEAAVTIAWCLPLVTLCSLVVSESWSDVVATIGMIEGEASDAGEDEVTIAPTEETDSPSSIDPPVMGTIVSGVGGLALVPHDEEVGPSKDPLIWSHPMDDEETGCPKDSFRSPSLV